MQLRVRLRELRAELSAARAALRIAACTLLAGAALGGVWLLGHLGATLGAAPMFGLNELQSTSGGLADGVRLLANAPMEIYRTGLDDPTWLILGFFAIAVPAALLPLMQLFTPDPEDRAESIRSAARGVAGRGFGNTVAACAMLVALLVLAWVASSFRAARLLPMPPGVESATAWLAGRSSVAGLDALALVAVVLWAILLLRVDIERWLRRLAGAFAIGAAAIMLVAAAGSTGAAAALTQPRATTRLAADGGDALLLGEAIGGTALLRRVGTTNVVEVQREPRLAVVGQTTVRAWLEEGVAE